MHFVDKYPEHNLVRPMYELRNGCHEKTVVDMLVGEVNSEEEVYKLFGCLMGELAAWSSSQISAMRIATTPDYRRTMKTTHLYLHNVIAQDMVEGLLTSKRKGNRKIANLFSGITTENVDIRDVNIDMYYGNITYDVCVWFRDQPDRAEYYFKLRFQRDRDLRSVLMNEFRQRGLGHEAALKHTEEAIKR